MEKSKIMKLKEAFNKGEFLKLPSPTRSYGEKHRQWKFSDLSEESKETFSNFLSETYEFKNCDVHFIGSPAAVKKGSNDDPISAKAFKMDNNRQFEGAVYLYSLSVMKIIETSKHAIFVRGFFDNENPLPENFEEFENGKNGYRLFWKSKNKDGTTFHQKLLNKKFGKELNKYLEFVNQRGCNNYVPEYKELIEALNDMGYKFDNDYNIVKNGEE